MQTKTEKLPKSSIKLTVTVEANKVKEAYESALDQRVKNTEIEGFRKGNAPRDMVKDKVGVQNLYADTIDNLLQTYYPQALKENSIMPIANPKVEIKDFDLEKDFEFYATIALKPDVEMSDYKKALKARYQERLDQKKKDNEERLKKGEKLDDSHVHFGTNDLIDVLLKESKVEIAEMLIEEETNRLMTRLVDQAQSIGLSMEQYLKAQNKTPEQLKQDYTKIAENNIKAEFILAHLVKTENVEVSDDEIAEAVKAVGDPAAEERLKDPMEKMYVRSILQKNKLITKLIEETEGENHHEH